MLRIVKAMIAVLLLGGAVGAAASDPGSSQATDITTQTDAPLMKFPNLFCSVLNKDTPPPVFSLMVQTQS